MDLGSTGAHADRQSFLRLLVTMGTAVTSVAALGSLTSPPAEAAPDQAPGPLTEGDRSILLAAQIAEALAVTTYTQIVTAAPFFTRLFPQDQAYLRAARQQEMIHHDLLAGVTGRASPYSAFFYPPRMFASAPTTLNTLIALEEAFIAAYLVGVRDLSRPDLRVTAARIMGVESDHRTMTRVLAPGLDPRDGGPLRSLTGIRGVPEPVDPPSNNVLERTMGWATIASAVATLLPFVDRKAATRARFDTRRRYVFTPFTPDLPHHADAL